MLEQVETVCPYCGEPIDVLIDCSVAVQDYIEDCSVCCHPIQFNVVIDAQGLPEVMVRRDDE